MLGRILAAAAGDQHCRRDVRGDCAALCPVCEGRADHLDVGAEDAGARTRPGSTRPTRGRRLARCEREGGLRALCGRPTAQQAVNRLRAAGLKDPDITVLSGRPMEEFEFGNIDKATWMWWIACGRRAHRHGHGLWSGVDQRELVADERRRPADLRLVAELIIMFELTMLGAIVATVITLVVTAGFGRGKGKLYDPEVSDGKILVGVENPLESSLDHIPPGVEHHTRRPDQDGLNGGLNACCEEAATQERAGSASGDAGQARRVHRIAQPTRSTPGCDVILFPPTRSELLEAPSAGDALGGVAGDDLHTVGVAQDSVAVAVRALGVPDLEPVARSL